MDDVLQRLAQVLEGRKTADPATSYTARLLQGADADPALKKVGEEATEVILAAKGADPGALVRETADLWFHTLVVLARAGRGPADVLAELERRFGTSGLTEKAARGQPPAG